MENVAWWTAEHRELLWIRLDSVRVCGKNRVEHTDAPCNVCPNSERCGLFRVRELSSYQDCNTRNTVTFKLSSVISSHALDFSPLPYRANNSMYSHPQLFLYGIHMILVVPLTAFRPTRDRIRWLCLLVWSASLTCDVTRSRTPLLFVLVAAHEWHCLAPETAEDKYCCTSWSPLAA